jgi:hypothetical protein
MLLALLPDLKQATTLVLRLVLIQATLAAQIRAHINRTLSTALILERTRKGAIRVNITLDAMPQL